MSRVRCEIGSFVVVDSTSNEVSKQRTDRFKRMDTYRILQFTLHLTTTHFGNSKTLNNDVVLGQVTKGFKY